MTIGGLDVAVPELRAEAEAAGEIEDAVGIGARLSRRRDDCLTELDQRLRVCADLEADLERLPFESGGDGQHHVGEFGGWGHEQISLGVELQSGKRPASKSAVDVRQQQVGAKADQAANGIRIRVENGPIEIAAVGSVPARRAERALLKANCRGQMQ